MIVQGIPNQVFPLVRLNSNWDLYFMDATGQVWSKRMKEPRVLSGSNTPSGRYFTLGGRTVHGNILYSRATNHVDFKKEVNTLDPAHKKIEVLSKSSQEYLTREGIKARGYVIATVTKNGLLFGSQPKIHLTETEADAELIRLAGVKPGTQFVSLKITKACQMQGINWS